MIKYLSTLSLLLLTTSCLHLTNTETTVVHNKFKERTSISNKNNYLYKVRGCRYLSFDLNMIKDDKNCDPKIALLQSSQCGLSISTESLCQLSIGKGCILWIHCDDERIELTCKSYSGQKQTYQTTSPGYCNTSTGVYISGSSSTSELYFENAFFVMQVDDVKKIANAKNVSIEVETDGGRVVKAVFDKNNFTAIGNFLEKQKALFAD